MLRYIKKTLIAVCVLLLIACHSQTDKNTVRIGTISGPETRLMEVAKQVAKQKYGLNLEIVEFSDYIEPNTALSDGSIEANMFQHKPFLDQQIKDRHYKLVSIGKTFVYPMGLYSKKITLLADVKDGSLIAIPNDPSNEGRALLLLQKAGLIALKPDAGMFAAPYDIEKNPKQLKFKELDAAQLARSLDDVEIAVINTNYAIPAGLSPTKDAILHEGSDSPYANIVVIREDEVSDPRMKEMLAAIQSPEVLKAAQDIFNGQAIPAWRTNS
jgi:D-methionine transport system substrate-binding protein